MPLSPGSHRHPCSVRPRRGGARGRARSSGWREQRPWSQREIVRRGFALVELVVALALGLVVLGAACRVLLSAQRYYRLLAATLEVHQGERAALDVLAAELRELDPAGGDLFAMGADSLAIRAARMLAFVCAPPDSTTGRIVIRDSLTYAFRAVDPTRDRLMVFREGPSGRPEDDSWLEFGVRSVTPGERCTDGAPGTALILDGASGALASVTAGSAVRTYERVTYRLYADAEGQWWLGVREYSGGAWAAISPVAGPFRPRTGLTFRFVDSAGAVTAEPRGVARVELAARGESGMVLSTVGGPRRFADSMETSVGLRNARAGGAP